KELNHNIESLKIATQVQEEVAKASPKATNIPGNNVIVTTLGTGSTLPSKYRNVSSTLLTIPNDGCILLDVGEGTLGSLFRHLGPFGKTREGQIKSINLKRIEAIEVIHCPFAYGISIEHLDGKNATLLLHEATFENDLLEEALNKKHSTTEEAVKIGERYLDFLFLIFKHDSLLNFCQLASLSFFGISFDFMQVSIGELYKLPKYVKALKLLYCEDSEEAKDSKDDDDWMQE
ncbi:3684_t:CDS:2, partial [Racocetra fulgida]